MRTFHIGGAASRAAAIDNVTVKTTGTVKFNNLKHVAPRQRPPGRGVAFGRTVGARHARPRARALQAAVRCGDQRQGRRAQSRPARPSPTGIRITTRSFRKSPVSCASSTSSTASPCIEKTDELTGLASREITDPKRRGSHGQGICVRSFASSMQERQGPQHPGHRSAGAVPAAAALDRQPAGRLLRSAWATWSPRCRRKRPKTRDITGGLPRVADLFEARKPKDSGDPGRASRASSASARTPRASSA